MGGMGELDAFDLTRLVFVPVDLIAVLCKRLGAIDREVLYGSSGQ